MKKTGKFYKRVVLIPFLVACGYHVKKDMIGEQESSWKNQFRKMGYEVTYLLKGLGEYPLIQKLYCEHIRKADNIC